MASLLELSKSLNEQLEIINSGMGGEPTEPPPFAPCPDSPNLIASYSEVERARKQALNISSTINQLLKVPSDHLVWTAHKVFPIEPSNDKSFMTLCHFELLSIRRLPS